MKKISNYAFMALLLVIFLLVAACGQSATPTEAPTEVPAEPTAPPVEEPTSEPTAEPPEEGPCLIIGALHAR